MKIEYLSKSTIPSRSANSVHVMKMCQAFAGLGHRTRLHALCSEEQVENDFAHYGVVPAFALTKHDEEDLTITRVLARAQAALPLLKLGPVRQVLYGRDIVSRRIAPVPDLLYARHLFWLLGAATADVPFIFESHQPPEKRIELIAHRALFRRRGFRKLVVISSKLKAMYMERFADLPADKILIAHDGADAPDRDLAPRIARTAERLQIGYVGHLYPGRGIELIPELAARNPAADFHLVGGTDQDVAALKTRLLPDNITVHGFVSPGEIGGFYASFDIFLAPYQKKVSVHGGKGDTSGFMSPLKVFEYMSWGRAILASDLPVLREVLTNQETALLLPPDDVDAWSEALRRLIGAPQEAKALGVAAREAFERNYSWSTRAEQILKASV